MITRIKFAFAELVSPRPVPRLLPGHPLHRTADPFSGNEFPNPQQACVGDSGLPVSVEVGANVDTAAGAHTITGNGTLLDTCAIDSTNPTFAPSLKWRGGVIVMPRSPLENFNGCKGWGEVSNDSSPRTPEF